MRVLLENLEPYRQYAIQVRGPDTEWSPTYVIQTERDRIAPPQISTLSIEGADEGTGNWYWYDRNLVITWGNYSVSDQSTWDHSHYMVQFVAHDDSVATFQTPDKKFVLTQALNAQNFGGKGLPAFKKINVWGVDRTGNPGWVDGPYAADTMKSTTYTSIINPPPEALQNVVANFETKDLIFTWTLPSGNRNLDNERIKLVLDPNGTAKTIYLSANTTTWTLTYEENVFYFGAPGDPSIDYALSVFDAFDQESAKVTGTATNDPPQSAVLGLLSVGIEGGIQTTFTEVLPATFTPHYKDHKYIQLWEKVMVDANTTDSGFPSLPWRKLAAPTGGTEYAFIPDDPSFAYRWIRAQYVDWFEQTGPITNSGGSYPVKMKSAVTIQAFAPPAPTNLAVTNSITGDALTDGQVYLTWTPPSGDSGEVLSGYTVQYQRVSPLTAGVPSWAPHKVDANRKYAQSVDQPNKRIYFADAHNFKVGDRVSLVNYGSVQHAIVVTANANDIVLDALSAGTFVNNSFDRSKAGTAVVSSSTSISLMPGTKYEFRVASESSTFTSEYSSVVTHTTSGNPLIAKRPLEAGTYYNPVNITAYDISSNRVTVTTSDNPTDSDKGFANAASKYVSITDSVGAINGRWPIVSVSSNTIVFDVDATPNASGSTTGKATAGTFALGAQVNGTNDGLYMNESNLWLVDTGAFRAGNGYGTGSWAGIEWNPATLTFSVTGDVTARSGYFTGNVFLTNSGALVVGQSYIIDTTRQVDVSASPSIKIPVISVPTITLPGSPMAQVLSANGTLDTGGTPVPITAVDNTVNNKYITITKSGVTGGFTSGTVMINAVTAMGERGLISTDATGKIKFMLSQSGLNRIGGWDITDNAIKSPTSVASNLRAGMSADATLDSFWAGGDSESAVFRVNESGDMYLGNASVTGTFNIGNAGATNGIRIVAGGTGNSLIYSGSGNYGNTDTPFYLSSDGYLSMSGTLKIYAPQDNVNNQPSFEITQKYGQIKFDQTNTWMGTNSVSMQILPRNIVGAGENESFILAKSDVDTQYTKYTAAIMFPTSATHGTFSSRPSLYSNYNEDRASYWAMKLQTNNVNNSLGHIGWQGNGHGYFNTGSNMYLESNSNYIEIRKTGTGTLTLKTYGIPSGPGVYPLRMGSDWSVSYDASSRRFKQDIHYMTHDDKSVVSEDIYKLEPVYFRYRSTPKHSSTFHIGYIAEDLSDSGIDWLVAYDEDCLPANVRYEHISIGLVEVAKQQKQEIDTLNQTVLQLEQRLSALEER